MANIKITLDSALMDGHKVTFKAPCDCVTVEKLKVCYMENGTQKNKLFTMKDSLGNDLTGLGNLFKEGAYVDVVLDSNKSTAYLQNSATNKYLEQNMKKTDFADDDSRIIRGRISSGVATTNLQNLGIIGDCTVDEVFEKITVSNIGFTTLEIITNNSETVFNKSLPSTDAGIITIKKADTDRGSIEFFELSTNTTYTKYCMDGTFGEWDASLKKGDIVDNLLSTSTKVPLSANQGTVLDGRLTKVENYKVDGGSKDLKDETIVGIVQWIGSLSCRAFVGRFKLSAEMSPTGIGQWYRGMIASQSDGSGTSNVKVNILAMADNNTVYTGSIYGSINECTLVWDTTLGRNDVVDNLTSTSTNLPLSAKQGKVLNDKVSKVKTYVGSDGKLHFVDASGADTVLPFKRGITIKEWKGMLNGNENYIVFDSKDLTTMSIGNFTAERELNTKVVQGQNSNGDWINLFALTTNSGMPSLDISQYDTVRIYFNHNTAVYTILFTNIVLS